MNYELFITWNPSVGLGPFRWYGLCWLIGLALAYFLVKRLYKEQNIKAQVVSVPSIGLFLNQDAEYRNTVIPVDVPAFGLTSGLPSTLRSVVPTGTIFGLDHFGASAPYKVLDEKFGFTPENIAREIQCMLK